MSFNDDADADGWADDDADWGDLDDGEFQRLLLSLLYTPVPSLGSVLCQSCAQHPCFAASYPAKPTF